MCTQAAPKPSVRAQLRTRQAIFLTWLITAPFVTSFVEDSLRGTARTTRSNTLANRANLKPPPPQSDSPDSLTSVDSLISPVLLNVPPKRTRSVALEPCSSSTITSISETAEDPPHRTISFAQVAHVYSEENPGVPVEEKVKSESQVVPLEARRKRAALMSHQNAHMPTSAAGKWLLRKTSSGDIPDV